MPVTRLADGKPLCLGSLDPTSTPLRPVRPGRSSDGQWTRRNDLPRLLPLAQAATSVRPLRSRPAVDQPGPRRWHRIGAVSVLPPRPRQGLRRGCAKTRPCRRYGPDGRWFCPSCVPKGIESCCRCGQPKRIHTRWPIGPLCVTCHTKLLDTRPVRALRPRRSRDRASERPRRTGLAPTTPTRASASEFWIASHPHRLAAQQHQRAAARQAGRRRRRVEPRAT
jgi:hypothetical protein